MLGVGVGFDTKGSNKHKILRPNKEIKVLYEIPDTREGWVISLQKLLESYLKPNMAEVEFDYSKIRPEGLPLKTFGGTSSGPAPLIRMHEYFRRMLE